MVGVAETAGIIVVTMTLIQILTKVIEHFISKDSVDDTETCILTEQQASELHELYIAHARIDKDGVPLWYVPRSWSDTQKEIVDKLQSMTNISYKMLSIIERLERRMERLDERD